MPILSSSLIPHKYKYILRSTIILSMKIFEKPYTSNNNNAWLARYPITSVFFSTDIKYGYGAVNMYPDDCHYLEFICSVLVKYNSSIYYKELESCLSPLVS